MTRLDEADRKAQIIEFKRINPMYQLLGSRTKDGAIPLPDGDLVETFFRALKLGLIDGNTKITEDGLAWLAAPFEL